MARNTKTRRRNPDKYDPPFMVRLPAALQERLAEYRRQTGTKKQFVVEAALTRFLDEHQEKK